MDDKEKKVIDMTALETEEEKSEETITERVEETVETAEETVETAEETADETADDIMCDSEEYKEISNEAENIKSKDEGEDFAKLSRAERIRRMTANRSEAKASLLHPGDAFLVAFIAPIIIMLIIFIQRGIFPAGDESFLRTDMYHQYAPFFSEFRNKITSGGSLLYSWDIGMGVNFSALYAYYLASPLNWLLILCPKAYIIEFMTYSIVLKTGLCGLSFAYYLRKHCKTSDFGVAFFGIFYALSGYMAAYSWNIMWLDCIVLFPLVMLGIERLVNEKKGLLYCVMLGLCILSNYYISIMICIFMIIYFAALLILEKREKISAYFKDILRFSFYSLLAGGLAAGTLLPEIYALQATASGNFSFPKTVSSYFAIFDMIARHIPNVETEIGLDHWPNIYCGIAVYIFFILYITCKKIKLREKVVYCSMLFIFMASFSVNILNFIWHGFHFPNSLPCRQSFIYIFILLYMCYRAYMELDSISWKNISAAFLISVIFVIMAEKLVTQEHFHFAVYYVGIIYLAIYTAILYLYKFKKAVKGTLILFALGVVSIEAAVNTTVTSITTTSRTAYIDDNTDVDLLKGSLINDTSFYRIEKVTRKTKNDGAWMNFPSVSLFSSTANANMSNFFKAVGCESSTNAYSITGSTPLVDALLSVKYAFYSKPVENTDTRICISESGETWLYQNMYTLPLGFMVSYEFEDNWRTDASNPAEVQNDLCEILSAKQVLTEQEAYTDGNRFYFTPEKDGYYYVYVSNKKIEKVTASHGQESLSFNNVNRGYLLDLGLCAAGEEVSLQSEASDVEFLASAYSFNYEGLKEVYEALNKNPLNINIWKNGYVEGTVAADVSGVMFTSIPYDKGWTVYIDGVKTDTRKIENAFLAFEVSSGSHNITMKYMPQGLIIGFAINIVSILILAILFFVGRAMYKKDKRKESKG